MSFSNRRTPLDVLVIASGPRSISGKRLTTTLIKHLKNHPAVRPYGAVVNAQEAMPFIREGKVNTIFIDPNFTTPSDEPLILRIREEFPKIVFVLYIWSVNHKKYVKNHERFQHYLWLDWLSTGPTDVISEPYLRRPK